MPRINDNFLKLTAGYLFPEIARRVNAFADENPDAAIIRLGIGDVTEPLPPACVEAMTKAVEELSHRATFRGYGPEQGYPFLRDAIAEHEYAARDCDIAADEIFVSDGSKCDVGNVLDILAPGGVNTVAVTDPVYPVYVDTNVMAANAGAANDAGEYAGLVYLPMTAENNFNPPLPDRKVDVIYLCSPNNPTGAVLSRDALTQWIDYAKANDALIIYDAAYEAFITDTSGGVPRSIYELPGARDVAIETRSFSKNAGFTGVRCAWMVVPKTVTGQTADGQDVPLHKLWSRRHATKFNGVSYIVQRGAQAVYCREGQQQVRKLVGFYMENARLIREGLADAGFEVYGGVNAPYVWLRTPNGTSSWDFFDQLLRNAHVVGTPGSGFGAAGEGYFRLSAFNSRENVDEALSRIGAKLAV